MNSPRTKSPQEVHLQRDGFHDEPAVLPALYLDLQDKLFSYGLLLVIMFVKAMVSVKYFHLDKDDREYKNRRPLSRGMGEFVME
jgi:hypothetical protein